LPKNASNKLPIDPSNSFTAAVKASVDVLPANKAFLAVVSASLKGPAKAFNPGIELTNSLAPLKNCTLLSNSAAARAA
tara:strand:+ start:396 stop:629 length:234 start_codon:yes stop_codon:yes gene_type:complete